MYSQPERRVIHMMFGDVLFEGDRLFTLSFHTQSFYRGMFDRLLGNLPLSGRSDGIGVE